MEGTVFLTITQCKIFDFLVNSFFDLLSFRHPKQKINSKIQIKIIKKQNFPYIFKIFKFAVSILNVKVSFGTEFIFEKGINL